VELIFGIIIPIFGTLGIGYAAARFGVFDEAANRGLSVFVFNFAIPLMLFRSIAQTELPDALPWGYLLSYFIGAFVVMGLAMVVGRVFFARRLDELAVMGRGASYSNIAMLGIPLVVTAYGPAAALPLFVLIACHSLVLLPPVTIIIEAARGAQQSIGKLMWTLLRGVATTPIIWGLSAGLVFAVSGAAVPDVIDSIAGGIGAAAAPCALFALGASLTRYRIGGNLREPLSIVALKTLVHPLLVWVLATQLFDLPELWVVVTPYLFAQRYQVVQSSTASTVFLSTLFSVLSLSVLLFVVR
jgi:malonate transporter